VDTRGADRIHQTALPPAAIDVVSRIITCAEFGPIRPSERIILGTKSDLSQNYYFYNKINLGRWLTDEVWETSGGKPAFPTMSLSELSFNSSVKAFKAGLTN